MSVEKWYTFTDEDWKRLEDQFKAAYLPVFRFITENKGSLSEARDVYIEAFYYYTRSVELKGKSYLEKSSGLIYSFSRIIWLKKLQKRNVDMNLVQHRREYYDLDHAFHEIDLMNERSEKAASKLALIGEPCRTMMLELIGAGRPFDEVGPRLGFTVEDRAISRLAGCLRKLIEFTENKTFDLENEDFAKCLNYVIAPNEEEKPKGEEMAICLAMTSRVVATVKNHVSSKERTIILREYRDRLLPDDASVLQKIEDQPKKIKMKPLQLISLAALIAVVVSGLTSFGLYSIADYQDSTVSEAVLDTLPADPVIEVPVLEWKEKSAFFINENGFALTSSENLSKGDIVSISNDASFSGKAEVMAIDQKSGLALLLVDSLLRTSVPFRFSQSPSQVGDELISLGYTNGKLLFGEATPQLFEQGAIWIGGDQLSPGVPLFSDYGEFKAIIVDSEEGNKSVGVEIIRDFIEMAVVEDIKLPTRNRLYYDNTAKKVEKLKPCILRIKYQA
ncbi:MAG: hypothetical protein WBG42_04950 [Cryomorphaceae bacterium]